MKILTLALTFFLLGCASLDTPRGASYPTLEISNRSGSSVRVLLNYQGREYRIGSAFPGKSCFRLNIVPEGASVSFGIRHIAEINPIWSPFVVPLSKDSGWFLAINQPSQAILDLTNLRFTEKC